MIPYYLLFVVIYMSAYCDLCKRDNPRLKKSFLYLSFFSTVVLFVVLTGLKGNVGGDYQNYRQIYMSFEKDYSFIQNQIEPLWGVLCRIFNLLNLSFPFFWFIIVCISLTTKFIFFHKLSPYFFLSLLIYLSGLYIERDFAGIRQGLSIGIAYMAILKYGKRKKVQYLLFLICAIGIHYSSLVFVLTPLLFKIRLNKKIVYMLICFGVLFVLKEIDILSVIIDFLPSGYIKTRINTYQISIEYGQSVGLNIGIFVRILILLFFLNIDIKKICISEEIYNFLCNGFLVSILCFLFFNNMDIIAHRMAYGFRELQIIIIPIYFEYYVSRNTKLKFSLFQLYSCYALVLFYRMLNTPHLKESYEYYFIFGEK